MKRGVVALLVVVLAVAGWVERDRIAPVVASALGTGPTPAASTAAPAPAPRPSTPIVRQRLVLIDGTPSTSPSFATGVRSALADAVGAAVPPRPALPRLGAPGVDGLHLVVHMVGTAPLRFGAPAVTVDVPAVPALPARPDMTAPGALDPGGPYDRWTALEAAWSARFTAALTAARRGAAAVRALPAHTDGRSAITAGVASLSLLDPHGDVAYLVASDLEENEAVQPAELAGHPVAVIQPDPSGSVDAWNTRFRRFARWAAASGAGAVTHSRPELTASVVRALIPGGRS